MREGQLRHRKPQLTPALDLFTQSEGRPDNKVHCRKPRYRDLRQLFRKLRARQLPAFDAHGYVVCVLRGKTALHELCLLRERLRDLFVGGAVSETALGQLDNLGLAEGSETLYILCGGVSPVFLLELADRYQTYLYQNTTAFV